MGKSTAIIKAEPNRSGVYRIVEASEKGLKHIKASTRDEFNALLLSDKHLQGRRILVCYPGLPQTLEPIARPA